MSFGLRKYFLSDVKKEVTAIKKLIEFSTLNISGGADILNEDILRTYGNLKSPTVMF